MKVFCVGQSHHNYNHVGSRKPSFCAVPKKIINYSEKFLRSKKSPTVIVKLFDSGITDNRLEKLMVTKHIKEPKMFPIPDSYTFVGEDGYMYVKPHLYINKIQVKREFLRQGVCKEVEQKIVELSKQLGYEGRVLLMSTPISGTYDTIPSPTMAHYKNGFRFHNEKANNLVERILKGELPMENMPNGTMYYPVDSLK